jgi:hypothetical protein
LDYWAESEAGVSIRIGALALSGGTNSILIETNDLNNLSQYAQHGLYPRYDNVGGLFDFELSDPTRVGQSFAVVLPQLSAIPVNAVYRNLHPINGWREFVQNNANQVYSALGAPGACPAPDDTAYQPGLTAGDWCVKLVIEDGGLNDNDQLVNGRVVDPGGVAEEKALATVTINPVRAVNEDDGFTLSASVDNNGNTITSYLWEQVAGPSVIINNANTATANVASAPAGNYTFRLTVTDQLNRQSSGSVNVEVKAVAQPSSSGGGGSMAPLLIALLLLRLARRREA